MYPSPNDVINGLKTFFDDIIDEKFAHSKSNEDLESFKKQTHEVFNKISQIAELN